MKKFFRNIILGFTIAAAVIVPFCSTLSAYADEPNKNIVSESSSGFLGLKPWYDGLIDTQTGEFYCVNDSGNNNCYKISTFIWTIVANVAADLSIIGTYLALIFVIYGGYKYMFAAGDAGKVAAGKKTLLHAAIGLTILILSNVIFTTVRALLSQSSVHSVSIGIGNETVSIVGVDSAGVLFTDLVDWFTNLAGIVAVVFVVFAGVSYITANGDSNKITMAKNIILYACIGLVIIGLSKAIVAFVRSTIVKSANNNTSYVLTDHNIASMNEREL